MDKKLKIELIPDGCWHYNLRNLLSEAQWNFIKKDAKERSDFKCSICGRKTSRLEAHEQWSYDTDKGIVKLENVIAICKDCHGAIHMNRTQLTSNAIKVEDHYMKVNNCSYSQMRADMGKANEEQKRLNLVDEWKLDASWLKRFTGEKDGNI